MQGRTDMTKLIVAFRNFANALKKRKLHYCWLHLVKFGVCLLWLKLHSTRKRALFTSTLDLELRKKLVKCYIWSIALYGADTRMLWAVDQKHL